MSRLICIYLFLLSAAVLLYFKSLPADFVLDAHCVVVNNPVIKQDKLFTRIFTDELFSSCSESHKKEEQAERLESSLTAPVAFEFNYYRPATLLSLALDYRIWKLDPFGYKLTNLILHSVNAFLVYLLLAMILGSEGLALLAAVYFLIFPIHEWVVNYVVGRSDILQAFFELLSLIIFYKSFVQKNTSKLAISLILFILALLSRENAILTPLLVFGIVYYHSKDYKKSLRCAAPFIIIGILYLAFRFVYLPICLKTGGSLMGASIVSQTIDGLKVWTTLAMRFVVPWVVQVKLLGSFVQSPWKLPLAGGLIILCIAAAFRLWRSNKHREQIFGWGWILVNFLPLWTLTTQSRYLGPILSEHYLYLSSVGFSVILSAAVLMVKGFSRWILIGLTILYYCVIVFTNNSTWTTEENILKRVSQLEGGQYHVAKEALLNKYTTDTRVLEELIAKSKEPEIIAKWTVRLASVELERQDYIHAEEHFLKAIQLNPANVDSYAGLALAQFMQNKKEATLATLEEGLKLKSNSDQLYRFLGIFYYKENKLEEAGPYLEKAYSLNPDNQDNVLYWGIYQFLKGSRQEAQKLFEQAIRFDKEESFACRFIAVELYNHQLMNETLGFLEEHKKRFSRDPGLLLLMGKIYFNLNAFDKARENCEEVLRLIPGHPEAVGCVRATTKP